MSKKKEKTCLLTQRCPVVAKTMTAKGNTKYTSNTVSNETLQCFDSMVQGSIAKEEKDSGVFSITVDESKDPEKKKSSRH